MPGVPSGRSCEGCRARKKKCDERQPVCSRCAHLGIKCVGAGLRRFKFRHAVSSNRTAGPFKRDSWSPDDEVIPVSRPPSNETSTITNSFASILNITDPGYSILTFGDFFDGVPRRISQNQALSAATKVLTSSVSVFYTGSPNIRAFTHYGKALKSLRESIASADTSNQAHAVNTICAIGLLCLSHNLLGSQRAEYEIHIRGILYMLSKMPTTPLKTSFERAGISAAWALVIGECIMDPSIKIDQSLIDRYKRRFGPVATDPHSYTTEFYSLRWENLLTLPTHLEDPLFFEQEIASTYRNMLLESPRLITLANQLSGAVSMTDNKSLAVQYILCETGNSEVLSMALVLNKTLQILQPTSTTTAARSLSKESTALVAEIVRATVRLDRFKPLGTARLPNALCLAWVAADTPQMKERMRLILDDHAYDFRGVTWEDLAGRYERRFRDIRSRVKSGRLLYS